MGYAGATYIVQEVCNALFDALFHILPLGTDLDRVEATPARLHARAAVGRRGAGAARRAASKPQPVLVRISAAKRLRDRAERDARSAGEERVDCGAARDALHGGARMTTARCEPSLTAGGHRNRVTATTSSRLRRRRDGAIRLIFGLLCSSCCRRRSRG